MGLLGIRRALALRLDTSTAEAHLTHRGIGPDNAAALLIIPPDIKIAS